MSTTISYIIGFALSIALTLAAFFLYQLHEYTHHQFPTHPELRVTFVLLAIIQILVQLVCFLHVARRQNKQWNSVILGFAVFVVFVVVGGSLWIMANLSANMSATGTYLNNQVQAQYEDD